MKKKYIIFYPDDFTEYVWNNVCDELGISPASEFVSIPYVPSEVKAVLPIDDDDYYDDYAEHDGTTL